MANCIKCGGPTAKDKTSKRRSCKRCGPTGKASANGR